MSETQAVKSKERKLELDTKLVKELKAAAQAQFLFKEKHAAIFREHRALLMRQEQLEVSMKELARLMVKPGETRVVLSERELSVQVTAPELKSTVELSWEKALAILPRVLLEELRVQALDAAKVQQAVADGKLDTKQLSRFQKTRLGEPSTPRVTIRFPVWQE
jgi:hypothetical protein